MQCKHSPRIFHLQENRTKNVIILEKSSLNTGGNIRKLRKRKGINQSQLADIIGVNNNKTISNWEKGVSNPSLLHCMKLCNYFGITLDELVRGELEQAESDAPQISDTVERKGVINQLRDLEEKVLALAGQLEEDREDREILLKKLADYEQVITDLKKNYPSPPSE